VALVALEQVAGVSEQGLQVGGLSCARLVLEDDVALGVLEEAADAVFELELNSVKGLHAERAGKGKGTGQQKYSLTGPYQTMPP